jgi:hypothetical protein
MNQSHDMALASGAGTSICHNISGTPAIVGRRTPMVDRLCELQPDLKQISYLFKVSNEKFILAISNLALVSGKSPPFPLPRTPSDLKLYFLTNRSFSKPLIIQDDAG